LLGQGAPVAVAEALDVGDEDLVLLRRPWPPLEAHLLAARSPPHCDLLLLPVELCLCVCLVEVFVGVEGGRCVFVFGDGSTVVYPWSWSCWSARVESRGCPGIYAWNWEAVVVALRARAQCNQATEVSRKVVPLI
jgi:hypothetical protein